MDKNERNLDVYLAAIMIWLSIIAVQQCENNTHMNAIRHEVMMLKYK